MKKLRQIVFLFLFAMSNHWIYAQLDTNKHIAKNTIFVEGLGNGFYGSINYEHLFLIKFQKFSYRFGCFINPSDASIFAFPAEFSIIFGKKHNFEIGSGLTYFKGANTGFVNGEYEESSTIYFFFHPLIYRYQSYHGGLFLKGGIGIVKQLYEFNTKLNSGEQKVVPNFLIAIGYTFKKK